MTTTSSLSAPQHAVLLEDPCPLCDWPKTVALIGRVGTAIAYYCAHRCGWVLGDRAAADAWDAAHLPVQSYYEDEEATA